MTAPEAPMGELQDRQGNGSIAASAVIPPAASCGARPWGRSRSSAPAAVAISAHMAPQVAHLIRRWLGARQPVPDERATPRGSETAPSGTASCPAAISSEPPPMSSSSRPGDQPNQRRAARKVRRASSGPGSTLMATLSS
jgi:hypothetical protein